jgi:hypothetical protein
MGVASSGLIVLAMKLSSIGKTFSQTTASHSKPCNGPRLRSFSLCLVSKLTAPLESIGRSLKSSCSILGGIDNAEEKRCHGSSSNDCRRRIETMGGKEGERWR